MPRRVNAKEQNNTTRFIVSALVLYGDEKQIPVQGHDAMITLVSLQVIPEVAKTLVGLKDDSMAAYDELLQNAQQQGLLKRDGNVLVPTLGIEQASQAIKGLAYEFGMDDPEIAEAGEIVARRLQRKWAGMAL
ncbi:MAG: hypothetical protein AB7G06_06370 [Bdellovibrionales bacterium]